MEPTKDHADINGNMRSDLLQRLESGYSLPALSVVAIKLVELASNEDCSVTDLALLIEKDPSLTVRLLRMANSAFLRAPQPASTVQQAILRIGFHQLRIMALSLSLRDTFPMGKSGTLDYERFWRTSLYRALLSNSLAQHVADCNPEEAFVAGLTLGIGFLIFHDLFIKGRAVEIDPCADPLDTLIAWEKTQFAVDHREIGAAALRHWKFPEKIVATQYGYEKKASSDPLSRICELARVISGSLLRHSTDFHDPFRDAQAALGLDSEVVNSIIVSTFQQTEAIADSLRIEVDKEKDLLGLMEKANQALSRLSQRIASCQETAQTGPPSFAALNHTGEGRDVVVHTLQAVAHEIRNPLVAVAGFARRLSSTLDPSSKGGKYALIILEEARRLEHALGEMGG
jgi:HD-like signal output (HDOD) protein